MKITRIESVSGIVVLLVVFLFTAMYSAEKISQANPQNQEEIRTALYKSYQHEKDQKYEEALKAMTPIQKNNTQNYLINMRMGWLYYVLGNYESSKSFYMTAIKVSPASIEAKNGCMLPLLALKRYSDVDDLARQVIADDKDNYYANIRYAYSLRMQLKFDQAEKIAMHMRQMYPSDSTVLTEAAMAKRAVNDIESAKAIFNEILNLSQDNKFAKEMLGKLSESGDKGKKSILKKL